MIPMIILAIENDDDRDFMARLYVKYYPLMCKKACEMLGEHTHADDLIHDTVVALIGRIPTLRKLDERQRVSYIITTMRNTHLNHIKRINTKKRSHTREFDFDEEIYNIAAADLSAEDSFINKETYHYLGEAINKLPEKERQVPRQV